MRRDRDEEEVKENKNKVVNTLIGIVDFCLAIYLVYNLIAMFA